MYTNYIHFKKHVFDTPGSVVGGTKFRKFSFAKIIYMYIYTIQKLKNSQYTIFNLPRKLGFFICFVLYVLYVLYYIFFIYSIYYTLQKQQKRQKQQKSKNTKFQQFYKKRKK